MSAFPDRRLGIVGWKNAGKTTLLARLVASLSAAGYSISTLKHAHHAFEIDHEGRDSWRHRQAGATETAIVSGTRWALMHELRGREEPGIEAIIAKMQPSDLLLIEGYKRESHPKIEVLSDGRDDALWQRDTTIIAIAGTTKPANCRLPFFDRDNVSGIAAFIIDTIGLKPSRGGSSHAS